jgi:hypothetical protein
VTVIAESVEPGGCAGAGEDNATTVAVPVGSTRRRLSADTSRAIRYIQHFVV